MKNSQQMSLKFASGVHAIRMTNKKLLINLKNKMSIDELVGEDSYDYR
jgi:hypothetical protein